MIKLDSIERWEHLAKGQTLTLPGGASRRVRLNVNSPGVAILHVVNEDGELQFLAAPQFRDVVEFAMAGDIRLTTESEDVYFYTAENEPTFTIIDNAEVFTRIANRAARNPDLEHLMYLQERNMQRRFAQMEQAVNQRVQDAYDAGRKTVAKSDAPGTVAPEPAPEPTASNGDGKPSGPAGGTAKPAKPSGDTGDKPVERNAGDDRPEVHGKPKA